MKCLEVNISGVKCIKSFEGRLPFVNGVYTLVGENGCGKSTILQCISQLISTKSLSRMMKCDVYHDAVVEFNIAGEKVRWTFDVQNSRWLRSGAVKYNGLYEGSLFYGTRFEDSTKIEQLVSESVIQMSDIVDADDYVKEKMSYILHGDFTHYKSLKRLRNREVAKSVKVKNLPYFIEVEGGVLSQYRMSSGECLLVSLLHFLYNSIERRSLPVSKEALIVIDELEFALHPSAITRLLDYLLELVQAHSNLIVYLSSHSPEVIRRISPRDMFRVHNDSGCVSLENNNYPSYLIRDLSGCVSPDYLLLVEDKLSQIFVEKVLTRESFRISKLIHCVPVGGWRNVLSLQKELCSKRILGSYGKVISILDGDVKNDLSNSQKHYPCLFLPIGCLEKFLYEVIIENKHKGLKKEINDKFFIVHTVDSIASEYIQSHQGLKQNEKDFYCILLKELKRINIKEESFIEELSNLVVEKLDSSSFVSGLKEMITK